MSPSRTSGSRVVSDGAPRGVQQEGMIVTDEQRDQDIEVDGETTTEVPPQYGVGPFSVREVALIGVWIVAFVVSFFSLSTLRFDSVWTSGLLWLLTIGVPTAAVFLIVLRRLSPDGIRRVGSLGIDQFASVAFSVSAVLWIQLVWETVAVVTAGGPWVRSWVMWVELILMLAGVVLTVFAPIIPTIGDDFRGRPEVVAHRNARPIRAVVPRPAPEPRPAEETTDATSATGEYNTEDFAAAGYASTSADPFAPAQTEGDAYAAAQSEQDYPAGDTGAYGDGWGATAATGYATTGAQPTVSHQAFWALAPVERDVVDEFGTPLFRIGPTAWALVIEDRGSTFVVRHEDGRVGYLHDVTDVTRG